MSATMRVTRISQAPLTIDRLILSTLCDGVPRTTDAIAAMWGVEPTLVKAWLVMLSKHGFVAWDLRMRGWIGDVRHILAYVRSKEIQNI